MKGFPWFCHKVLPLVYDDSLSYYEVLCKLTKKINEVIELAEELKNAYEEILSYYENIRQEIDEAIDEKYAELDAEVKAELNALETRVTVMMEKVLSDLDELKFLKVLWSYTFNKHLLLPPIIKRTAVLCISATATPRHR